MIITLPMSTTKVFLISFLFSLAAQAETMNCTITESISGTVKNKTQVKYVLDSGAPHGIQPYDVEFATGFIAVSRGYVVVQVQTKADQRAFSFHAKRNASDTVGGLTCLADASTCISVECQ